MDFHFGCVNQPHLRWTGFYKTCYAPETILPTSTARYFLAYFFSLLPPTYAFITVAASMQVCLVWNICIFY